MAKKSPEAKHIADELKKEFEQYKSKVLPKFKKRARGKLRRLQKSLNRIRPLKIRAASAAKIEKELKAKLTHVQSQISQARKKATSDRARIKNLSQEIRRLKKEIPLLEKNVRAWSRVERSVARKHKKVSGVLDRLEKGIGKLEKRKEKIVHSLQKYF
jgi:chromosome segregation ATPase